MGIFDRFRSADESRGRTYEGERVEPSGDEQALARYRYMLKTAPPETIEQAHVEALPPVSMSLPPESGLELVETRSKAAAMPEPEIAPQPGPRRVRPPRVVVPEEPLQIIETRKEDSPPAG